jgi:hypothetical protein
VYFGGIMDPYKNGTIVGVSCSYDTGSPQMNANFSG